MSSITAVSVLGLNDHPRYFFFRENDIVGHLPCRDGLTKPNPTRGKPKLRRVTLSRDG